MGVARRVLRQRRLLEEATKWAAELAAELAARGVAVEWVILFGSLAGATTRRTAT